MKIKVEWGTKKYKADPAIVAKEIDSIGSEVYPQQIVDYATSHKGSELYKCFTWNNNVAADKWRLYEARQIVDSLKITYSENENGAENEQTVRLMLRTDTVGGYKQTLVIIRDVEERQKMLSMAISELNAFRAKYKALSELEAVFVAIDLL